MLTTTQRTRYRPLWDMMIAGPPQCPVLCRLYGTVYWSKRPGNIQNGGTILPIANLAADSESRCLDSSSSFLVTIYLSRLVSKIFPCEQHTDGRCKWTITITGPHIVAGWLTRNGHNNFVLLFYKEITLTTKTSPQLKSSLTSWNREVQSLEDTLHHFKHICIYLPP